jgi:exopolysaccharide biosynthesis polyprenyl glycosylphosphotransferase
VIRILNRSVSVRILALGIVEAMLVFSALFLAFWTGATQGFAGTLAIYTVMLIGGITLCCMYCLDVYQPGLATRESTSLPAIVQAIGLAVLVVAIVPDQWVRIDSANVVSGMLFVTVALTASRSLFAELTTAATLSEPAVVWGSGALAEELIRKLSSRPDFGTRIVGIVDRAYAQGTFAGVPYLGTPELLWTLTGSGEVRRIIVALEDRRGHLPVQRLVALKAGGVRIDDGTELYEQLTGKVWLEAFSASALVFSPRSTSSRVKLFLKRCISAFSAVIAILISAPVMLLTTVLIKLDSPGPVIFRQRRVGENGRHFTLYKFRSMKAGSDAATPVPAAIDDPRCTRVGKWIRRLHIDELPQLFNILKGEMYFVGPRPFVLDQENQLVEQIPHYRERWMVRPGATGWAQVHRGYCASIEDNVEKLSYDLFYVKNLSPALDVVTLAKTFKILILGRGGR